MASPAKTALFLLPAVLLAAASLASAAPAPGAATPDIRHPPTRAAQWREIASEVAAMPRTAARAGDVWFVGFAGFGEQKVFRDESDIRWRVVVVSACYSGIFIPALKSDTTLVMTAADSRHSSFGCDDTRDLTWFGEALLKDAMPRACSLDDAYRDMAALIQRRETEEDEIHSNPRLSEGARMREKLQSIDAADGRACPVAGPIKGK